jgi:hypothetical protein
VFVKDFRVVELDLALNGLNSPIEGQGVCIWHHLGSLHEKFRMLQMLKKNYESNPNFVNKRIPNASNTSSIYIILVTKISLQDMSYKSRHKKVQHSFV